MTDPKHLRIHQKLIKYTVDETKDIVFLSDLHLGHDREFLWGRRGFKSVEEHDDYIMSFLRECLTPKSIVFNLGDVCFNDPKGSVFSTLSRIECREHYVLWGNHNSGAKNVYKRLCEDLLGKTDMEVYPLKHNNITFCGDDINLQIGKKILIAMSHFPKHIWDCQGHGAIHLSGHSHGNDPTRLHTDINHGKCLDVGVESAQKFNERILFTFDEIIDIMLSKQVSIKDHHDHKTIYSR